MTLKEFNETIINAVEKSDVACSDNLFEPNGEFVYVYSIFNKVENAIYEDTDETAIEPLVNCKNLLKKLGIKTRELFKPENGFYAFDVVWIDNKGREIIKNKN